MTSYLSLTFAIALQSGLHIGTGYGMASLLDERIIRGPHAIASSKASLPYIPGSSLKGRLRMHAAQLVPILCPKSGAALCRDLFGTAQESGRLFFGDAHLDATDRRAVDQGVENNRQEPIAGALLPYLAIEERARVALSLSRRTALEDRLMRFEAASPGLMLSGEVSGWLPRDRAGAGLALLMLAARAVTHIGGHKGRGLGSVVIVPQDATIDGTPADFAKLVEELK
jgi:CRISPR/Cas system CSM-associated protein Csm3 (group 7 of RAMP superfamily)